MRYIAVKHKEEEMDQHIKKVYVPMTETAFYILLCLREPNHGYGIVQTVEKLTEGAIRLAPGPMYDINAILCQFEEEHGLDRGKGGKYMIKEEYKKRILQ